MKKGVFIKAKFNANENAFSCALRWGKTMALHLQNKTLQMFTQSFLFNKLKINWKKLFAFSLKIQSHKSSVGRTIDKPCKFACFTSRELYSIVSLSNWLLFYFFSDVHLNQKRHLSWKSISLRSCCIHNIDFHSP